MAPELHDDIAPLASLLGTWRGRGVSGYPTTGSAPYEEEMRFEHVGEAFLLYAQRRWLPDDAAPIHLERAFFRLGGDAARHLTAELLRVEP